jgi:SAM-dependent methyltransferase
MFQINEIEIESAGRRSKFYRLPSLLRKTDTIYAALRRNGFDYGDVLNVGSKSVRLPGHCTNLDISPGPQVDVVGDAHRLVEYFDLNRFDTVVLEAMLQYCRDPRTVIAQAAAVLKPNGVIAIDAPFIQPYCRDGADLWRFTADGLRELCRDLFEVIDVSVAIPSGSAVAFTAQAASRRSPSRFVDQVSLFAVTWLTLPLTILRSDQLQSAGAIILIGQKTSIEVQSA